MEPGRFTVGTIRKGATSGAGNAERENEGMMYWCIKDTESHDEGGNPIVVVFCYSERWANHIKDLLNKHSVGCV